MKISWIFADGYQLDPSLSTDTIKNIGPAWGSWRTWRSCGTDNVVCNNLTKTKELVERNFQRNCNFYIPKDFFNDLNRPANVNLFDGSFPETVSNAEDIISAHLASANSDIILLVGFRLAIDQTISDKFLRHQHVTYHGLLRSLIANTSQVQWVCVDSDNNLDKAYSELANLTCDNFQNVLQLLSQ